MKKAFWRALSEAALIMAIPPAVHAETEMNKLNCSFYRTVVVPSTDSSKNAIELVEYPTQQKAIDHEIKHAHGCLVVPTAKIDLSTLDREYKLTGYVTECEGDGDKLNLKVIYVRNTDFVVRRPSTTTGNYKSMQRT